MAVPKPSIFDPLDILKASIKTKAFTTKEKRPKVKIVSGKDSTFNIGLITALTSIRARAVIIIA